MGGPIGSLVSLSSICGDRLSQVQVSSGVWFDLKLKAVLNMGSYGYIMVICGYIMVICGYIMAKKNWIFFYDFFLL